MQSTTRVDSGGPIDLPSLKPTATWPCPRCAFKKAVCVADICICSALFRTDGFNLLDLQFLDGLDEVIAIGVDEREETAVGSGTVRAREEEVIRHFGVPQTEIGRDVRMISPFFAHVFSVHEKGVARLVCGIEPSRADDDIDFLLVAVGVNDAIFCDALELRCEAGDFFAGESLEVSVAGRRTSATDEEVGGHDILKDVWPVTEEFFHFVFRKVAGVSLGFGAVNDELEALVKFTFDHFGVC